MAKQVVYDKNGKVLVYDCNFQVFVLIDENDGKQFVFSVEKLVDLVQKNLTSNEKEGLGVDVEAFVNLLKKRRNGKRREDDEKNGIDVKSLKVLSLAKQKPLVRVDDVVKEFSFKGLEALVRKQVKNSAEADSIVKEALYVLYENYFKRGDIPSLFTVKRVVKSLVSERELQPQQEERETVSVSRFEKRALKASL